jgi:hypothetical protein
MRIVLDREYVVNPPEWEKPYHLIAIDYQAPKGVFSQGTYTFRVKGVAEDDWRSTVDYREDVLIEWQEKGYVLPVNEAYKHDFDEKELFEI